MHPEYLFIPVDLPNKIQRITHMGREPVATVDLMDRDVLVVSPNPRGGSVVMARGVVLIDSRVQTIRIAKALAGAHWLLADRAEKHGPYLQNILQHSLLNPGQLGSVGMFVEHCTAAGITGKARQVLISDKEVIYLLTIEHTGTYELARLEEDTLYMHGALLTQQQIVDQFNADNQRRIDRVGKVFDAFGEDGFIMPTLES